MARMFDVFLWPRWRVFGVTTLIPTYDRIPAVSAFEAIEKGMRVHRFTSVGHAVAEGVSGGGRLVFYRAYGVKLGEMGIAKKQKRIGVVVDV